MIKTFLFFVFLLTSQIAAACGCNKPTTVEDAIARSHDSIFKGRVTNVVTTTTNGAQRQLVTFAITEMIRGQEATQIVVSFGGSTSCDLETPDFRMGKLYLISASQHVQSADKLAPNGVAARTYFSNYCDLRKRVLRGRP